jgi:hypothetical protein
VSIAGAVAFTGAGATSAADTIFTALGGSGNGNYLFNMGLAGTLLRNSAAGLHTGVMTLTIA